MNYPNFIENKLYYSNITSSQDLEQVLLLSENLKKLHGLTVKDYANLDELILDFLQEGLKIFSMEIGIVSKIEGEEYTVCNAVSPEDAIKPGDIFPLEGTYCREVCKSQKVLGFPSVGSMEEMKDHPVYENMKLESYISAPIFVHGKLFGTLNFTSTKIKESGFSEHEKDLISMMSNSISRFLVSKENEENLISTNNRLRQLVGFVSHDLRTPLGNISSFISLLRESSQDEVEAIVDLIDESSKEARELVSTILDMASIGTGKIQLDKKETNLKDLVERSLKKFAVLSEKKKITFQTMLEDNSLCSVDEARMFQVISNLISNSIKYSALSTNVSINLFSKEGYTYFLVENAIPEIRRGTKIDSIGFGLEIVRDILKLHDSELIIDATEANYKCCFKLKTTA